MKEIILGSSFSIIPVLHFLSRSEKKKSNSGPNVSQTKQDDYATKFAS